MIIARSYWRSIKLGQRKMSQVPTEFKKFVETFAETEVKQRIITEEEYKKFIGKTFKE